MGLQISLGQNDNKKKRNRKKQERKNRKDGYIKETKKLKIMFRWKKIGKINRFLFIYLDEQRIKRKELNK